MFVPVVQKHALARAALRPVGFGTPISPCSKVAASAMPRILTNASALVVSEWDALVDDPACNRPARVRACVRACVRVAAADSSSRAMPRILCSQCSCVLCRGQNTGLGMNVLFAVRTLQAYDCCRWLSWTIIPVTASRRVLPAGGCAASVAIHSSLLSAGVQHHVPRQDCQAMMRPRALVRLAHDIICVLVTFGVRPDAVAGHFFRCPRRFHVAAAMLLKYVWGMIVPGSLTPHRCACRAPASWLRYSHQSLVVVGSDLTATGL
jgi:hypothetical protein